MSCLDVRDDVRTSSSLSDIAVKIRMSCVRLFRLFALLALSWGISAQAQSQGLAILQQPVSLLNSLLGGNATFSVSAHSTNSTVLRYQWRRNGVNLPGATNSTCTVSNVQGTNSGAYTVVVTDGFSTLTSTTASLTADISILVGDVLNLINVTGGVTRSSNLNVPATTGPVIIPGYTGGHAVTFKWTPLLSGVVTFTTTGSDFETVMGAFTGNSGNLQQVASSVNADDSAGFHSSQISFNAQGLTEYQIIVDGYNGATGNIVLSWSENVTSDRVATFTSLPPPATDASNAAPASFSAPHDSGSLLWYFNGTPTATTSSTLSIAPANDSTVGTYFAKVTSVHGNVTATRGADLQIALLQDGSTPTNSFAWKHFSDAAKSPYTGPAQQRARKLSGGGDGRGYSLSQTFSTVGATSEPGEPVVCNQIGGAPEWYVYVTPTNGTMEIDTAGSGFNTILGVFVGPGTNFATLTNLGGAYTTNYTLNGQPQIFLKNIPANQTNYIVVDGENGTSGTVHLHINMGAPVALTTPPANLAVPVGSNATFSVAANGSTAISYFWQYGGTNIPWGTNSTLTITNVQPAQQGIYTVVVSNLVSTTNCPAVLSLLYPPSITNQPQSQEIATAGAASFTCLASGTGRLNYQWMFGTQAMDGATNSILAISPVAANEAGSYSCIVTNVAGVVTSLVATLTVDTAPVIFSQPMGQTVASNATVTLNVGVSATPTPFFQWYFNGVPIGANASSLTISNFTSAQAGNYSVTVSNSVGVASSTPAVLALNWPLRTRKLSLTNGRFQFQSMGPAGSNFVIQVSTDLTVWTPIYTNFSTNGILEFTDSNAPAVPGRFYRTVAQ